MEIAELGKSTSNYQLQPIYISDRKMSHMAVENILAELRSKVRPRSHYGVVHLHHLPTSNHTEY